MIKNKFLPVIYILLGLLLLGVIEGDLIFKIAPIVIGFFLIAKGIFLLLGKEF